MASKKKKKKFSEQVITGTYESSMTKDKVGSALKSNSMSVAEAYKSTSKDDTSDRVFSAFDDGYDVGDITKSLLKGSSKLGKTIFNTGKEIVTNPIESLKTGGIGVLSGIDKADTLINNAVDDLFDWVVPGRKEKDKGLTLKEFNQLSSATDEKTKKKLLKEYAEKYGKDSSQYKTIELQLETDKKEKNVLNWKYTDSEAYKKAQAGELSEGQQNIYGVGENVGAMLPSMAVAGVTGPVVGSAVFFTQSQQSYTEDALAKGYEEKDARIYGMIMGGMELGIEQVTKKLGIGVDETAGFQQLSLKNVKKTMAGEGLEEFVMPYLDDLVTYTGFEDGYSLEKFGESSEEALEGAVMGATVGVIMSAGNRGLQKVDKVIQKVNTGQEITQEDLVEAGKEIQEKAPELLEEAMKEVPEVVRQELEKQNATMNQHTTSAEENLQDIAPVGEIDTTEIDEIAPVVAQEVLNPTLVSGRDVRTAGQQDIAPVEAPVVETEQAPVQDNRYVYTPQETDSQYKQAVSKSAETVGLENNASTQTMIDLASKVSERTGKQILFTNNSQPEMVAKRNGLIKSYAKSNNISIEQATTELEGTTINGLTDGESILINTDSNGYLNVIVGHEITHTFENTGQLYTELQDAVFKYASEIGEFEEISDRISRIYEGQNANLNQELTSELVGRYLFTDQSFIDSLKAKKPNVFQRMYNEIKHLIKMATAGSKEAKALEEVKYRFEKAMNSKPSDKVSKVTVQETKDKSTTEPVSNTQEKEESVQEIETEEPSKVSENVETDTKTEDKTEEYSLEVDNKGRKLTEEQVEFFEDSVVRDENGNLLTMYHGTSSGGYTVFDPYGGRPGLFGQGSYFTADNTVAESYTEKGRGNNKQIYEVYLNITNPIDMDGQANVEEWKQYFSKHLPDAVFPESGTNEEFYRSTLEEFENSEYDRFEVAEIMIETFQKMGYDGITHIGGGRFNQKDDTRHRVFITFESNQVKDVTNTNPTESDDIRYSLSKPTTDSEGRTLTKEQQEHFKDSKVRDADGNLKVMYHGTPYGGFNIFELNGKRRRDSGFLGNGFYFTSYYDDAVEYSDSMYLNDDELTDAPGEYGNIEVKEVYLNIKNPYIVPSDTEYNSSMLSDMLGVPQSQIQSHLKSMGYDGIIYDSKAHNEYVVFESNQIKNVDNTKPTESEDIRYSLTRADDGKVVDENNKPIQFYRYQKNGTQLSDDYDYNDSLSSHNTGFGIALRSDDLYTKGKNESEIIKTTISSDRGFLTNSDNIIEQDQVNKVNEVYEKYVPDGFTLLEGNVTEKKLISSINMASEQIAYINDNKTGKEAFNEFYNAVEKDGYITTDENGVKTAVVLSTKQLDFMKDNVKYSLSVDNQGNEIKPAVQKWSEKSQARDENGQLKVLYHGSPSGEFTVFDKNKANPEGDWGAGFYLTDNEYDVESNYADGGGDFDNKVSRLAETLEGPYHAELTEAEKEKYQEYYTDGTEIPISWETAKKIARERLYKGYYRIDAYANIENPAIVGKTYLFSDYYDNYNMEDFESEEEYYEAVDQLAGDDIDTAIWEIERTYDFYNGTDGIREVLWEAYSNGGIEIQELKDKLDELYLETDEGLVGSDVARIIIESQGYDGIIDPTVSSKFYGMHLDEGTTHYIVFKPNQIKNISNENPTDNPDINMSLSKEGEELAPIGDFNIKGSDVRLQKQVEEAIAPLKEEIETLTKTITDLQENIAPASFESAEEQRAETQRTMTDEDAPLTDDGEFVFTEDVPLKGKGKDNITREIANDFDIKYTEARELYNKVANTENPTVEDVFDILKDYRNVKTQVELDEVNAIQHTIKGTRIDVSEFKKQITDYKNYRISNMGKGLIIGNSGEKVDSVYQELNEMYGDNAFPSSVTAEVDQLDVISQWLYKEPYLEYTDTIDDDSLYDLAERILSDVGNTERYRTAEAYRTNWFRHYKDDIMAPGEAPRIKTEISQEDYLKSLPDALTDDYAPFLEQAREVNASNTENTAGNVSISDELSRLSINPQEEVNEAQNEVKYEIERPLENPFDDFLDNFKRETRKTKAPRVTKEKPGLKSAYGTVQELIFNDTYQIDKLAKETNRPSIKHNNYMLKGVYGEIPGDILVGQTDNYGNIIGKSVKDLWKPAHDSGLFNQFNDRMKHQLNIERWKTNKPLWFEIPADASKEIVKAYDETYPQFKEWADDIYNFYANSLDNKFEAGLVNESQRKLLREELYPSYVRIDVEQLEKPYVDITPGEIRSKAPLKRAVGGSGESAMSLEESMIKSVYADKMGIRQNKLYLEIAKALEGNRAEVGADVRQELADMSEALYLDADTGQYYLTAYENGEQFTVEIDKELYDGLKNDLKQTLKNIETKLGKPLELVQKAGNLKRDLTTTYNPFFWLTNPPKDLFDGLINSKNVKGFMKNYPIAWKEAITNTGDAPKFRALYGSAMDMGDYASESGLGDTDGKLAKKLKNTKLLRGINKLNEITEVVTRLAEFKASKEAGASLEEAMYNAREVTVNFDRGGTVTKFLDRNGFKFLNVSAQGFDKFIRNFSGQEGARATMGAWSRAVAFGIAPALINHLLFGGDDDEEKDEDYEALPDYIKDNYFLFKMDNGEFVRIPKGRMMAVFGSAGRRTLETLEGEEDAFEGFLENSESQVGMANPFDNFLLAPLFQAYGSENGTTWYGEELIPSRLQDKAPEEQYDASTDKLSIFLGETFGISPYKINYVIDQYTGGIGDLVLPMITEETKTDGSLMAPFVDKFTANSTDDNKYASEIYSLGDKRDKVPTAEKETDLYKIQDAYLYSITSEMGELYAEKREVQADSSLSKKEKYEMVQEIQKQINSLAKEGLENYEYVSQKENYAIVGGREFNKYTASDGSERWGTPWEDELNDLNSMGMDLAEKNNYFTSKKSITEINDYYKDLIDSASEEEKDALYTSRKRDVISAVKDTDLNDEMKAYLYNKYYSSDKTKVITKLGIDFDSYLDFESQQFEADKNSAGKSISGSKKAKVFNYINSMNLDFEERLILAKLQYSSYDQYNAEIINYLNNHSDISYDEEVEILQKLGFTVDENGRIYWK